MLNLVCSATQAIATNRLHVVFGGAVIPHPAKVAKGGEDAFVFDDESSIFGVADGVGGSARNGVDPGAFSREMLERCHQSATCGMAHALPDALSLATGCPLSGGGGSSTLVLGQLETSTSTMRILNLGDSGAIVLRPALRELSSGDKQFWPRVGVSRMTSLSPTLHTDSLTSVVGVRGSAPHARPDAWFQLAVPDPCYDLRIRWRIRGRSVRGGP